MYDVREETREKITQLNALGHLVCEIWECEWNRMKNSDVQINQFVHKPEIVTHSIHVKHSLAVELIKLYHKIEDDERIYYNDMTLFYLFANMECNYPVGHPKLIDQPVTTDISKFYGLMKFKVIPPYNLYHPF